MRIGDSFSVVAPAAGSARGSGAGFAGAIRDAIERVDDSQAGAQSAAADLLVNGRGDVHTVALAAQSAELSLELFQQVRNKFVSAYQEIMKMPM
ncbi:MAG TPA: flagellar hook-basal body complex protein FliE [Bryobacteraceae bacterium]|nr:flagellar hook-basal body complex protein FliE [Bryobacteraceae bacterium]